MTANLKLRNDRIQLDLVRMSTRKLSDDYRHKLRIPLKTATATIAECLATKRVTPC